MIPNFCALVQRAIDGEIKIGRCCIFRNMTVEPAVPHTLP
jgi:hypothetical protein